MDSSNRHIYTGAYYILADLYRHTHTKISVQLQVAGLFELCTFSVQTFIYTRVCLCFIAQNVETCIIHRFSPLLNGICCSFEGWPDPLRLPIEPASWIFYECLCVQVCVCVGPSAASIPISAAAGVIVPQWLQCRSKKTHYLIILQRAIWRKRWSEDTVGHSRIVRGRILTVWSDS